MHLNLFSDHFTPCKVVKPLRCKRLLSGKEKKRTIKEQDPWRRKTMIDVAVKVVKIVVERKAGRERGGVHKWEIIMIMITLSNKTFMSLASKCYFPIVSVQKAKEIITIPFKFGFCHLGIVNVLKTNLFSSTFQTDLVLSCWRRSF